MIKTIELIEQLRFAELKKIATLSKAQEAFLNNVDLSDQDASS